LESSDFLAAIEAQVTKAEVLWGMRLSYYEKLVVLNGGTLAISFTAVTALHGQLIHGKPLFVADLLSAWQLLIIAIVGCLLADWLGINSIVNFRLVLGTKTMDLHGMLYQRSATPNAPPREFRTPGQLRSESRKLYIANCLEQASLFLGMVSQGATLFAYICLYKFEGIVGKLLLSLNAKMRPAIGRLRARRIFYCCLLIKRAS
jgi:hypothetical protein